MDQGWARSCLRPSTPASRVADRLASPSYNTHIGTAMHTTCCGTFAEEAVCAGGRTNAGCCVVRSVALLLTSSTTSISGLARAASVGKHLRLVLWNTYMLLAHPQAENGSLGGG